MQYVVLACRCAVAAVFAFAVVAKSRSRPAFRAFRASVRDMVPELAGRATYIGVVVVIAEASAVVLLAYGRTVPVGFIWAGVVLLALGVGIARALRAGTTTPCGCFGVTATPLSRRHLVRNAAMLVIAVIGLISDLLVHGGMRPAGVVLGLAGGGVLASFLIFFDDLADLLAEPR